MEQFYSILKEIAENCDFENRDEAFIRDIFNKNMLDDDKQRELLRDIVLNERLALLSTWKWAIRTNSAFSLPATE